jgi:hypothetical protein
MNKLQNILTVFYCVLWVQIAVAQSKNEKQASVNRKFVHQTEFGFLLGNENTDVLYQAYPIYNNTNNTYDATSYSIYPPYYVGYAGRKNNFSLQHFSGYKIRERLAVGITAGFDYYARNIITPIALGIRSQLLPLHRISPTLNIDGGYGLIWKNKTYTHSNIFGGFMLNPSAGLRIKLADDGSNIFLNVGYRLQKAGYENSLPEQQYYLKENRTYNRLSVRLGFGF